MICRRTQTNSRNPCWATSVVSLFRSGRGFLLMNDWGVHWLVSRWIICPSSPLWEHVHKLCLALAILKFLSSSPNNILLMWRRRQNHGCLVNVRIIDSSIKTRVFILMRWSLEWLFKSSSDSVETETDSRLVARCSAAWLLRVHERLVVNLLLSCLQHWEIGSVCCILKCTDNRLLDCKLLHRVWWICSQSQLRYLRRISILRVWVILSSGLLRAEFIITLDYNSAELERVLVGCLDINEQTRSPAVVDTRLVIWGGGGLLGGAATRVEHLETAGLAGGRLLAVPETLLGRGQWLLRYSLHELLLLVLLLLVGKALVVAGLQLLVQALHQGQGHTRHQLQLPGVDHWHLWIPAGEGNDCTGQVHLVHIEETLLLNAEICKELSITPKIFRVLLCYLPCHIRWFCGCRLRQLLLLLSVLDRVCVEETSLVDEHMHVVEYCVSQHVPIKGCQDFTFLRNNRLVGVGVASCWVKRWGTWIFHLMELSGHHKASDSNELKIIGCNIWLYRCVHVHHQHTMMNSCRWYLQWLTDSTNPVHQLLSFLYRI